MAKILQQLKINKNFKFIDLYFESRKPIAAFVEALNNSWPVAFSAILKESNFTEERKKQYALESLYHTTDDTLEKVNFDDTLSAFVSTHEDFLNIQNPNIQRLVSTFELLDVKFQDIDYTISNKELFQAVYQHNFYIISFKLICLMLKEIYACHKDTDLIHKNYTVVLSKLDEPLVIYLEENINDYVDEVLNHCDGKVSDTEETVVKLLNNTELSTALKENYINKLTTLIQCLPDISEDTLWPELLGCDLVVYSEDNVLQYFFHSGNGLDASIAGFINDKGTSFNFDYDAIESEFEKGDGSKFFNAVVKSEFLNIEPYAKILKSLNRVYNTFSTEEISDPKMDVLIAQGIIPMKSDVLLFVREHYPQKLINFIKRNIKNYTEEVITAEVFDFNELLALLDTDISDKYKLQLLQYTEEPISAKSALYSVEIKAHILQHNFNIGDLSMLLKAYLSLTESLQTIVEDIAKCSVDEIIENEYLVPVSLCKRLLTNTTLDNDVKLELLAVATKDFNEFECQECLEILNQRGILSAFYGKRPAIPITNSNEKILDAMVKKHWIASYDVDKKDETVYRVIGRRIPKQSTLPTKLL